MIGLGTIVNVAAIIVAGLVGIFCKKLISEKFKTSLTICIGAMAIVGAIQDGIAGDYSILFAKAILDFIIVVVLASSLGKGCVFAALPVALFQGSITLLARLIEPVMTEQALSNISLTGSMMIFCIGINLVWDNRIKVANMLPTILFAVGMAFLG